MGYGHGHYLNFEIKPLISKFYEKMRPADSIKHTVSLHKFLEKIDITILKLLINLKLNDEAQQDIASRILWGTRENAVSKNDEHSGKAEKKQTRATEGKQNHSKDEEIINDENSLSIKRLRSHE